MLSPLTIAVIGPAQATPHEEATAEETGRLLAEAAVTVVCGGRGGVMAAVCRGARETGGRTVGILPGEDRAEANPWVDVAIPTGLGEARNALVVRSGNGVIAVGGGYGTLSEVALALKAGRPVVGIGTWELVRDGELDRGIEVAADPEDAVRRVLARLGAL